MKPFQLLCAHFIILFLLAPFASAIERGPVVVKMGLRTGYVPQGFDDNDRIQVTVEGYFSDSCYKVGPYRAQTSPGLISISQFAYKYLGVCLDVIVPFHQVVDLGILPQGTYKVVDTTSGTALGVLPISKARSENPDDDYYAPVSDASVITGANPRIVVTGAFTDSCLFFKEVRVRVYNNIIEVLPIVQKAPTQSCQRGYFPFQRAAGLQVPRKGRYLLHVRSMEGQAINKLVDIY